MKLLLSCNLCEISNELQVILKWLYSTKAQFINYSYQSPLSPPSQETPDPSLSENGGGSESPVPGLPQPAPDMSLDTQTGRLESLGPQSLQVGHLTCSEEQLRLSKPVLTGVLQETDRRSTTYCTCKSQGVFLRRPGQ